MPFIFFFYDFIFFYDSIRRLCTYSLNLVDEGADRTASQGGSVSALFIMVSLTFLQILLLGSGDSGKSTVLKVRVKAMISLGEVFIYDDPSLRSANASHTPCPFHAD